jgi:hypothetical protein
MKNGLCGVAAMRFIMEWIAPPERLKKLDALFPRLSFAKTLSGLYFQPLPQAASRS